MLVLFELFCHDIRRQSLLLVRPQNRGAIEFLGKGVWLWQHFDGTASRPSLPTWWEPQFQHRVVFCEAVASRMCCNLSSLSIHDSSCGRTLSCSSFWWMAIACNRQRNGALCSFSPLACCCMRNKEKAIPFRILKRNGLVFMGWMPILC